MKTYSLVTFYSGKKIAMETHKIIDPYVFRSVSEKTVQAKNKKEALEKFRAL